MIYILFIIYFSSIVFSESQESIHEKMNLANSYIDAGLHEDAIIIYKNILLIQKDVLGDYNPELIKTLFSLSDLYLIKNNQDSSEIFLQKALDIQHYNFLIKQKDYIKTYKKLKNIYLSNQDSTSITKIDSLLIVLDRFNYDSLYSKQDSLKTFPKIISFDQGIEDSTNLVSEYSLNDQAIELFNSGIDFLNQGLFSESIVKFDQSLKINSSILNLDYLLNTSFGDSIQNNNLLNALEEIVYFDSTVTTQSLFSAIISKNLNKSNDQVIDYLKQYIKREPTDIKGYLLLANIAFDNGEYIDAMHYYHRILLIQSKHFEANLNMAKCLIELEDFKAAISQLKIPIKKDPNNFESKFYMGYCLYQLGYFQDAIKELTQSLLLNSSDADTYYYLGKSYLNVNKKKQGLESLMMSINLNPYNGDAHFELGKIYESILKTNLALEEYRLAYKYIKNHQLNYMYGMLLYKEQQYNAALTPLREFIIYEPENKEVLEILGKIFINENRFPESIDTYHRLIEFDSDNAFYYSSLALSYYELNNYQMSKKYYDKVLSFNEDNPEILLKLGSLSNLLYAYDEAERYLLESIYCGYTSKNILFELGLAYGGQKKYLQALITLQEALNYSLDDPILNYQIGVVSQEMSIFDLAIDSYKIYADTNSKDPIVFRLIGDCYKNLSNYKDAIINYKKAYDLYDYDDINILHNLGFCYFNIQDYNNAAKYFKSIIRINPDHAITHNALVNTYFELNKLKEVNKECDILFMLDRELFYSNTHCSTN